MSTGSTTDGRGGAPIGIFDSGVGGLSVLRAIRERLPDEQLLFVADSRHCPYGDKPEAYIRRRSLVLARFLAGEGAKAIVVACNTATAAAAERLRTTIALPVVAMEPAVKPAAAATRTGVVGVLATVGTLESARFAALLARVGRDVEVVTQPAPGLVERVEAGELDGGATRALVERYTGPLVAAGADTIVLGSTHFAFLRPLVADVVGPDVALIETGPAVARQLERVLDERGLRATAPRSDDDRFWTSGDPRSVGPVVSRLLGRPVDVHALADAIR